MALPAMGFKRADVHGVVTFYHYFRRTPPGKHVVSLCRAESCQALGADQLAEHAKRKLGVDFHETTADGEFSLEPIYCLGNCACSPAAMVDGRLYGRLTPETLDFIRESLAHGGYVRGGSDRELKTLRVTR